MGLDQYAYAKDPRIIRDEEDEEDWGGDIHIMDWRKHNRLQGYMEQVWLEQGGEYGESWSDGFNGKEVKLGKDEIDALEEVIENRDLPETSGFFFGNDSYEDYENEEWGYLKSDIEFIAEARKLLAEGFEVYYNSSW